MTSDRTELDRPLSASEYRRAIEENDGALLWAHIRAVNREWHRNRVLLRSAPLHPSVRTAADIEIDQLIESSAEAVTLDSFTDDGAHTDVAAAHMDAEDALDDDAGLVNARECLRPGCAAEAVPIAPGSEMRLYCKEHTR